MPPAATECATGIINDLLQPFPGSPGRLSIGAHAEHTLESSAFYEWIAVLILFHCRLLIQVQAALKWPLVGCTMKFL